MPKLIPVLYNRRKYPSGIKPKIEEIAANFDSEKKHTDLQYSLHTEYSYREREFSSPALIGLDELKSSDKKGVPRLWASEKWAEQFATFIERISDDEKSPEVIEVHPPFDDYTENMEDFVHIYSIFEDRIRSLFPESLVVIENRYGSQYRGGKFRVSKCGDIIELSQLIKKNNLRLKLVLDFAQLFSSHNMDIGRFTKENISSILERISPVRENISSVHLWGKCLGKTGRSVVHTGTLDSYFNGLRCDDVKTMDYSNLDAYVEYENHGDNLKTHFLTEMKKLLDDNKKRYFVPEVNSREIHLQSIVNDLLNAGFEFV